jgi:hypothetical protein
MSLRISRPAALVKNRSETRELSSGAAASVAPKYCSSGRGTHVCVMYLGAADKDYVDNVIASSSFRVLEDHLIRLPGNQQSDTVRGSVWKCSRNDEHGTKAVNHTVPSDSVTAWAG